MGWANSRFCHKNHKYIRVPSSRTCSAHVWLVHQVQDRIVHFPEESIPLQAWESKQCDYFRQPLEQTVVELLAEVVAEVVPFEKAR